MFTERTMIDRLLRIHGAANADALGAATWYRDVAARDCINIAGETGIPFRIVAATMAILSPGPRYAQNVTDTGNICRWAMRGFRAAPPTVTTYGANARKAATLLEDYMAGADRDADPAPYVSGPKVTAFYRNIIGECEHVTLDRHAVRPLSKAGKDTPTNKAERARMTAAYVKAAARVGLTPSAFQAVVWVAVRGAAE